MPDASLILNHAFLDGNKRIGVVLAGTMLVMNGYQLEVGRREMVSFTLSVAEGKRSVEEIAAWLGRTAGRLLCSRDDMAIKINIEFYAEATDALLKASCGVNLH